MDMDFSYRHILILYVFSFWTSALLAQVDGKPERTPEQEATKQTEAMQRELGLTQEQAVQIHEINLKYAKERQETDTRAEAMERMLHKNEDYKRILTKEQYQHLQSKRVERRTRPLNDQQTGGLQSQRPQFSSGRPTAETPTRHEPTAIQQPVPATEENRNQTSSIRINNTSSTHTPTSNNQFLPRNPQTTPPRVPQQPMKR